MIYGERVRQVREMHRLTQADLIKEVPSLTQSRLSRIEKDLAPIDEESLALVAAVTGVTTAFFSRPPTPGFSVLSPQLRSRSRLTQGEKAAALQWARLVDEEYQHLRTRARALPVRLRPTPGATPEEAAAEARKTLGFSADQPLPYLILAAERAGVTVLGLPYAIETLDAFCAWRQGEPVIALLGGVAADRVRFSVAHEIGHLLLHQPGQTGPEVEAEADRFAAELLTPLAALRAVMPHSPTLSALVMLKTIWGVSVKSLVRRAKELGAVDGDRALSLYKQMSSRGWNKREPGYVPPEKPRALRKMAEIVHGPGVRTERFAAMAAWSEELALTVLAQHATVDELPHEPAADNATRSDPTNVIPFRPRALKAVR
jgi:Zn-dependent peptidase ImmA (M78 family)/transcriptional regulator with XRE-family HTH domain